MKNIKAFRTYTNDEIGGAPVTDAVDFETVEDAMASVDEWMHTDGETTHSILVLSDEGVVWDFDPHDR